MHLPPKCLEQLKCFICNRLLSLFPIYTMKVGHNELLSVCGRCQVPDYKKYLRNEIYETLAKLLLFPCANKEYGCMDELLPKDMAQHELTCRYRQQSCIFDKTNNCQWKRGFNQLLDHCRTEHANLILENYEFQMNMNENCDVLNVLQYEDELFLFKYSFDQISKRLKCSITPVCLAEEQGKYYAQINLTIDGATMSRRFPEVHPDPNKQQSIDINIDNMLNENNPIVMITIKITTNQQQLNSNFTEQINEILLKSKCSLCNGILYPPIYQCREGHYACNNCRIKSCTRCSKKSCNCYCSTCSYNFIEKCTSCSETTKDSFKTVVLSPFSDAMNFINYRCQYAGCKFIGNAFDFKHHLDNCLYKPYSCLLKDYVDCKWEKHRKHVAEHIFQEHKQNTIRINEIIWLSIDIKSDELQQYHRFLRYSDNSFKIVFQYKNPYLLWRVEIINSIEESCNYYKFKVTIYDKNDTKLLSFKESCSNLTFIEEYDGNNHTPCVWLHVDQVKNSIHDNVLSFKIDILK